MNDTEFKVGDIVATVVIILSLVIAIVIAVCCRCNRKHKQNSKKIIVDRDATYIPVAKIMGSDCGVCLDTKDSRMGQIVKLHCNHTFHQKCMTESLKSQTKCPLCRQRVNSLHQVREYLHIFRLK
ncbi:Hypothetical predicted protein [Mytilus galloprovincialis]|uniref:RING-type domain-containing protein n=1 Tax=Mytilus galloprovincialis TaxID=29158 RepID=A0A8B6DAB3_MYTGA|nr:Hypothetical predicted protein [Mytilus galloprovincialis]